MLDRYRKPGGFIQLLGLLETCGPAKQEKFLQIIRAQDGAWAQALEARVLTIARIFTWKDSAVAELVFGLPDLTIATVLHGLDANQRVIFTRALTHAKNLNIQDLFGARLPSPAEVNGSMQKILVAARKLITEGRIRLNEIDPELVVPDDIEECLKKAPARAVSKNETIDPADYEPRSTGTNHHLDFLKNIDASAATTVSSAESATRLEANLRDENMALRRKVTNLGNENGSLKQDIVRLQMKIEQIRKMAA